MASYSVERHIAYIKEVRTAAADRGKTRTDASVRPSENKDELPNPLSTNIDEQPRPDAAVRASDDRYTKSLERENDFLRGQIGAKDKTIEALLERDRETNHLIAGLQKHLTLPERSQPHSNE